MVSDTRVSASERTWRLPRSVRLTQLTLVPALFAILLSLELGFGDVLSTGSQVANTVVLSVTIALLLVYLVLVWRSWQMFVTLTADTLVIRNMFTTRAVPLANISEVMIASTELRVFEGGPAWQRHVVKVARGVGPDHARRRAEKIAGAIAVAARLPVPVRYQPYFSAGATVAVLLGGASMVFAGIVLQVAEMVSLHSSRVPGAHPPVSTGPLLAGVGCACWGSGVLLLRLAIKSAADRRRAARGRGVS